MSRTFFRCLTLLLFLLPILPGGFGNICYVLIFVLTSVLTINFYKRQGFRLVHTKLNLESNMLLLFLLVVGYSVANSVYNGLNAETIKKLFQILICFLTLVAVYNYRWRYKDYQYILRLAYFLVWTNVLILPFVNWSHTYRGLYAHANALGAVLFMFLYIITAVERKYSLLDKATIGAIILLLLISNCRSIQLAVIAFFVLKFAIGRWKNFRFKWMFWVVVGVVCIVPIVYMALYYSELGVALELWSRKYLAKNFFSGRQHIWGNILTAVAKQPIFGYGLSASAEVISGTDWSSHHWYLQIALQMGLCGLILLLLSLKKIWDILYFNKARYSAGITSAFMIGVLLWQGFEVSLTQNNFSTGIMVWFLWGMGLFWGQKGVTLNDEKK